MKVGTVCFILDHNKVLLALIEYSPTARLWNGIGGHVDEGETPEQAVLREIEEETYLSVDPNSLCKMGDVWLRDDFQLIVYTADKWSGELKIKDPTIKELQWFEKDQLPYEQMIKGNDKWVPMILNGKKIKLSGDKIEEVEKF